LKIEINLLLFLKKKNKQITEIQV